VIVGEPTAAAMSGNATMAPAASSIATQYDGNRRPARDSANWSAVRFCELHRMTKPLMMKNRSTPR
jgi:hypothetical protein